MADPYVWHVAACREGYGNPHARMLFYVQRYLNVEGVRYNGEQLCVAAKLSEEEAQALADRCNAGRFAGGRDQAVRDADGKWIAAVARCYL